MTTSDAVREALSAIEDALNAEGFGCACAPGTACSTCRAREVLRKHIRKPFERLRAAIAAERAQDSAHRSAQSAVYAALGPNADPDRATWPDQIRALRERADALARAIAAVAGIAHAGGLAGMSAHDALAAIRLILA